jgi:amphi-Trp domain-containing protein
MELIEYSGTERMRREEAAARLRQLADELSRQNEVTFTREGTPFTVKVPAEVELTVEVEISVDGGEIEIEIGWSARG